MADWIRSPLQRWFTNTKWIEYAFEAAKTNSTQWNSYYGSYPKIFVSPGINPSNPMYKTYAAAQSSCGICELIINCGGSTDFWNWLCEASKWVGVDCPEAPCAVCANCDNVLDPDFCDALEQICGDGNIPCGSIPADCNFGNILSFCNTPPSSCQPHDPWCLDAYGRWVECDNADAVCSPCGNGMESCSNFYPCPCVDGGCSLIPNSANCPSVCCIPGEPGCVECCHPDDPNCGFWVPEDLCCTSCEWSCAPWGYPMPPLFCDSCEYCNIDPNAQQCFSANCCQCSDNSVWFTCDEVEAGACDPPECGDFSANCYECNGSYIPIWFGCYGSDPCPNPYNPDCTTGEEIVCYDYNTNDPIYYNASNLGASVIIEYDNPTAGSSYSYGNVATLCSVPDSLQLCVYLVDSNDNATQLSYEADFTINEQLAQVTINNSVTTTGYAKIRLARCSDDKRMFLTFKDGAKLSAEDLNTSLHQLLFLIQEKEFASNTYYQVANDDGQGNPLFTVTPAMTSPFNFNLTSVAQNDVLVWDGNGSFVGSTPSQLGSHIQLDNLSNVNISNVSSSDFLTFDGTEWVNAQLPPASVYFEVFESYNTAENSILDDYYVAACDSALKTKWLSLPINCMTGVDYNLIPNAITSFGLGYYAAQAQINDQLSPSNTSSALQSFINSSLSSGTILTSLRWEIGKTEGRDILNIPDYPVAYFDVTDFDSLEHPSGVLTGSDPTLADIAYYRPYLSTICTTCKNKLFIENISKFLYSGDKSRTYGFEFPTSPVNNDPSADRYLARIRSAINKADWGAALGYTEEHPLTDYPSATHKYTDTTNELIYADYTWSDAVGLGNYNTTKNLPSIVTYYLSHLWDKDSGEPNFITWDGNMDVFGKIDTSGLSTEVSTYLGQTGNYWFYWRWWITGHDSDASGTNLASYDTLTYYNPHDPDVISLTTEYSILPASVAFGTDYVSENDDVTMAKTGSYSYKVDANKVFSNLERILPDLYDEYVFEVSFATAGQISSLQCADSRCYEIVAKIEKFIDGCNPNEGYCSAVGAGSTNSAGSAYHVYPDEFNADVVRAWDTYPYDKLGLEVRNKRGDGFDLVIKAPRIKRIGLIDVMESGQGTGNFRQLALDFITDYHYVDWDDPNNPVPAGDTNTKNLPPEEQDMLINQGHQSGGGSATAFSVETAVQFIRVGLPSNIRVSFYTITTPQSPLFEE